MKAEKKADRAMEQAIEFENKETRADSGFFHLIHRDTTQSGSELATYTKNRKMLDSRNSLKDSLSAFFSDGTPCSILACILALPECPADWSTFSDLLLALLAERGWSFWESLPTAKGQIPMTDFMAFVSDHNPYSVRQEAPWSETKAISKAQSTFESYYRGLGVHTTMKQLEYILDPQTPDFFRRCIIKLLEDNHLPDIINTIGSDSELMDFCCERLGVSTERWTTTCLFTDGAEQYSLADILGKLVNICAEISKDIRATIQKFETPLRLSAEAYDRYCQSKKIQKALEDKLKSKSLLYCSSIIHLSRYVEQSITDLYEHVDVIKRYDAPWEHDVEDSRFRLNGHIKADEISKIPRSFSFSWMDTSPKTINAQSYCTLKIKLCDHFCAYRKRLGEISEISPNCLEQNIDNILALSLQDMFSVRENYAKAENSLPMTVTLAPVIAYSVFHRKSFIKNQRLLEEIPTKFLLPRIQEQKDPAIIAADIWLFSNLCRNYQYYYGADYSEEIQDEWNAAFLVYSRYGQLYSNPNLFYEVERELAKIGGVNFPHSPYYKQITACLDANSVAPAHGVPAWKQERIVRFHPRGPGDPGWSAVVDLRRLLEKDETQSSKLWLEQFWRKYLLYGYTSADMFIFVRQCFCDLFKISKAYPTDYQPFVDQHDLLSIYNNGVGRPLSPESITLATLEYTMRFMLEEQCRVRLYQWLGSFIDYAIDELNREE